jgi:hypothetical protein
MRAWCHQDSVASLTGQMQYRTTRGDRLHSGFEAWIHGGAHVRLHSWSQSKNLRTVDTSHLGVYLMGNDVWQGPRRTPSEVNVVLGLRIDTDHRDSDQGTVRDGPGRERDE